MEKFILLAERRSGTSLLIDCLENHPDIICGKRVFGIDKKIKNPTENEHSGDYFLFRTASLKNRFNHYVNRRKSIENFMKEVVFLESKSSPVIGFRFIYNNVKAYPQVIDWCKDNNIKVVHLIRKNILKTYISTVTARLHKMHHPREGDQIKTAQLKVDIDELLSEMDRRANDIEVNRKLFLGAPYMELVYEDFVKEREIESHKLLEFLGIEKMQSLESTLKKINPSDLSQIIANYEEVKAALSDTPYEHLLNQSI